MFEATTKTRAGNGEERRRAPSLKGLGRVLLVVGGGMQAIVKHVRAASADIMLYLDVQSEIDVVGAREVVFFAGRNNALRSSVICANPSRRVLQSTGVACTQGPSGWSAPCIR